MKKSIILEIFDFPKSKSIASGESEFGLD